MTTLLDKRFYKRCRLKDCTSDFYQLHQTKTSLAITINMRFPNTVLMMFSLVITGAAADCLSTNGKEYPFGTYTCDGKHKIVSIQNISNHTLIF